MSNFWSAWIVVLTLATIIGLVWLLLATRKLKNERDDNTTGHVYDGIIEEDNPLPAWWFWMFILSVIFAVGYLIAYPGLGSYKGALNWTSEKQLEVATQQVEEVFSSSVSAFSNASLQELVTNPKANNMGRRLFATNCSVCHGRNGEGGFGFPDLTDTEWQWGGSDEQIMHSIRHGRKAAMMPWRDILGPQKLPMVVDYVRSLTIDDGSAKADSVQQGKGIFQTYCASCHSADGSGDIVFGAPSLIDDVWLYGSDTEQIYASVSGGRSGVMPAHQDLLSEAKIRLLTAYVISLRGLEK